uniref:Putative tick transposon n=1 Tax=Ixodes ricinus TaxID=34613 RepID=A0A6B0U7C8_IXORI
MNQLTHIATLIQFISSTVVFFTCYNSNYDHAITCINLIAVSTCRARYLSICIKTGQAPPEVETLFGCLRPSDAHSKRVCNF